MSYKLTRYIDTSDRDAMKRVSEMMSKKYKQGLASLSSDDSEPADKSLITDTTETINVKNPKKKYHAIRPDKMEEKRKSSVVGHVIMSSKILDNELNTLLNLIKIENPDDFYEQSTVTNNKNINENAVLYIMELIDQILNDREAEDIELLYHNLKNALKHKNIYDEDVIADYIMSKGLNIERKRSGKAGELHIMNNLTPTMLYNAVRNPTKLISKRQISIKNDVPIGNKNEILTAIAKVNNSLVNLIEQAGELGTATNAKDADDLRDLYTKMDDKMYIITSISTTVSSLQTMDEYFSKLHRVISNWVDNQTYATGGSMFHVSVLRPSIKSFTDKLHLL